MHDERFFLGFCSHPTDELTPQSFAQFALYRRFKSGVNPVAENVVYIVQGTSWTS